MGNFTNNIANFSYKVIFQVILVFIFLTIFFFMYVTHVEKNTFKDQINLIVDDIFDDINIESYNIKDKDLLYILLNSYLELEKEKIDKSSKKNDDNIEKQNKSIFKKSLIYVTIAISILLLFTLVLISIDSFVIYFQSHIFLSIIGVCIVAITEYLFLNLISKKYYSVNPGIFRRKLSMKIKEWLKANKKI